ncbi:hypothetical protein F3Y22_tig00117026pilonHSYRG00143 [Hibiscus syriacus]|uniref:xylose isomerase n=1 Tax=Hibiscus syriacus TaxID=106335 RepID=A0A6A2XB18_HIBSY|nr:hypothetical protein F3Y22_tig00117026pilonHSYRG00143 [Hibiscus syriacus]
MTNLIQLVGSCCGGSSLRNLSSSGGVIGWRQRESTDVEDMFIAHIVGMDTLARGLRNAAKLIEDGSLAELIHMRYASYDNELGALIEAGKANFEMLEKKAIEWVSPWLLQPSRNLRR